MGSGRKCRQFVSRRTQLLKSVLLAKLASTGSGLVSLDETGYRRLEGYSAQRTATLISRVPQSAAECGGMLRRTGHSVSLEWVKDE